MKHSVPYMWGTVGIGYRKSKVETPTSWGDVLDSDKYAGRIALLADQRIVIGCALKYLGYLHEHQRTRTRSTRRRDLLIKQKKNIKAFAPDEGQNMLVAGDVDIVMEWNGDILQVHARGRGPRLCRSEGGHQCLRRQSRAFPRMRRIRRMPMPSSTTSSIRTVERGDLQHDQLRDAEHRGTQAAAAGGPEQSGDLSSLRRSIAKSEQILDIGRCDDAVRQGLD